MARASAAGCIGPGSPAPSNRPSRCARWAATSDVSTPDPPPRGRRRPPRAIAGAPALRRLGERASRREHPGRRSGIDVEVDHLLPGGRTAPGSSLPEPRRDAAAREEHDVGLPQRAEHGLARRPARRARRTQARRSTLRRGPSASWWPRPRAAATSRLRAGAASACTTPPPATMTGRSARASSAAARSTSLLGRSAPLHGLETDGRPRPVESSADRASTSAGSSR